MIDDAIICVPCYNNESTIRETLSSILNQNYQNFRVLVVDNCSTDGTFRIAAEFAQKNLRLQVIKNPTNLGLEGNLGRCIELADATFTAIWHADDLYAPSLLSQQIELLLKREDFSAVFAHGYEINASNDQVGTRFLPPEWEHLTFKSLNKEELLKITLKYGNIVNCPTLTARTAELKSRIRRFNFEKFKTAADLDAWFKLAEFAPIGILTSPLFSYRSSQSSFTTREVKKRIHEHDFFIVLNHQISEYCLSTPLTKEEQWQYEFLKMKDLALRAWNWRLLREQQDPLESNKINWRILFQSLLKTSFHRKFGFAAISIFTIRKLGI